MIPVVDVNGFLWGEKVLVILEYCFGINVANTQFSLSNEHAEYKWVSYPEAASMLKWDSNKTALWELNDRLEKARPAAV